MTLIPISLATIATAASRVLCESITFTRFFLANFKTEKIALGCKDPLKGMAMTGSPLLNAASWIGVLGCAKSQVEWPWEISHSIWANIRSSWPPIFRELSKWAILKGSCELLEALVASSPAVRLDKREWKLWA